MDAQHGSHMDDDYSYQRYVSNFNINTVTDHQQLLVALGSLSSSVEQYMPHSANCVKCKNNKRQDLIELLADSSASLNFTHERSDLSELQEVHDDDFDVQTAMKSPPLAVKGWDICSSRLLRLPGQEAKNLFACTLSSTYQGSTIGSYLWEPY